MRRDSVWILNSEQTARDCATCRNGRSFLQTREIDFPQSWIFLHTYRDRSIIKSLRDTGTETRYIRFRREASHAAIYLSAEVDRSSAIDRLARRSPLARKVPPPHLPRHDAKSPTTMSIAGRERRFPRLRRSLSGTLSRKNLKSAVPRAIRHAAARDGLRY